MIQSPNGWHIYPHVACSACGMFIMLLNRTVPLRVRNSPTSKSDLKGEQVDKCSSKGIYPSYTILFVWVLHGFVYGCFFVGFMTRSDFFRLRIRPTKPFKSGSRARRKPSSGPFKRHLVSARIAIICHHGCCLDHHFGG